MRRKPHAGGSETLTIKLPPLGGSCLHLFIVGEELFSTAVFDVNKVQVRDLGLKLKTKDIFSPKRSFGPGQSIAAIDQMVFSACYSSEEGSIDVYNRVSKTCLNPLKGHAETVTAIVATEWTSASGEKKKLLISGSEDKTIKIWDLGSMTCIKTLEGHTEKIKRFTVAGNKFFSGSADMTIIAWDLQSFQQLRTLSGHTGQINSLVAGKKNLFSASSDHSILAWDIDSLDQVAVMKSHTGPVTALAIEVDFLFSGSLDHNIKIWNINNFNCCATLHDENNWAATLAVKNGKLYSDSTCSGNIIVRDFTVSHRALLKDIAAVLREKIFNHKNALEMLDRIPQSLKNSICADEKGWRNASDLEKAEMIELYLKKIIT